ncbi:MAG: DUF2490 domain-containing protein [Bacteroidales bacterium]|nr:DUF2490 domain-containing protein [Bacteroidales bacterium]
MMRFLTTMVMTIERVRPALLMLIMIMLTGSLKAQYSDFRSWFDVELSKDFSGKLEGSLDFSQRFKENITAFDRSLVTGSVEYQLIKNLEIEGGYRYILVRNNEMGIVSRYRIHGDLTYDKDIRSFNFQVRERIQYGFDDLNSINELYLNKSTSRSRIKLTYDIFGLPVELYTSFELFISLGLPDAGIPSDYRIKSGMEYLLSHKSSLEAGYMLDNEINTKNPLRSHILIVTYSHKL